MLTFDEWFVGKYGRTFDALHQTPMTPYDHTMRALTTATRDYVTETLAQEKSASDSLTTAQKRIAQLVTQVTLLESELVRLRQRELERAISLLRFS